MIKVIIDHKSVCVMKNKLFDGLKVLFIIFLIGCFVGFIYEEIFYLITEGILEKRGFLYGPWLPVYGFGAVFMVLLLKRFKNNKIIFFIMACLVTGILEYITGYAMNMIWHKRWWDYTGLFLNINGYVCLRSVLSFGIGGLILIYIIEPFVRKYYQKLKSKILNIILMLIFIIFIGDNILSFLIRNKI